MTGSYGKYETISFSLGIWSCLFALLFWRWCACFPLRLGTSSLYVLWSCCLRGIGAGLADCLPGSTVNAVGWCRFAFFVARFPHTVLFSRNLFVGTMLFQWKSVVERPVCLVHEQDRHIRERFPHPREFRSLVAL
jgi:hypothetical protein